MELYYKSEINVRAMLCRAVQQQVGCSCECFSWRCGNDVRFRVDGRMYHSSIHTLYPAFRATRMLSQAPLYPRAKNEEARETQKKLARSCWFHGETERVEGTSTLLQRPRSGLHAASCKTFFRAPR
jgi:hypothetical protein